MARLHGSESHGGLLVMSQPWCFSTTLQRGAVSVVPREGDGGRSLGTSEPALLKKTYLYFSPRASSFSLAH